MLLDFDVVKVRTSGRVEDDVSESVVPEDIVTPSTTVKLSVLSDPLPVCDSLWLRERRRVVETIWLFVPPLFVILLLRDALAVNEKLPVLVAV